MAGPSETERVRPLVWLLFVAGLVGGCVVVWVTLATPMDESRDADGPPDDGWSVGPEGWQTDRWRSVRSQRRFWSQDGWVDPELLAQLPEETPEEVDPQIRAMRRSMGTADAGIEPHFYPTERTGRLTSIRGSEGVAAGSTCEVRVLPVRAGGFNCLVRVMCEGVVLYPDASQEAGYVPCQIEDGVPTLAVDDGYTDADGDPTVSLDLHARRVVVTDDAPGGPFLAAEVQLDALPRPRRL